MGFSRDCRFPFWKGQFYESASEPMAFRRGSPPLVRDGAVPHWSSALTRLATLLWVELDEKCNSPLLREEWTRSPLFPQKKRMGTRHPSVGGYMPFCIPRNAGWNMVRVTIPSFARRAELSRLPAKEVDGHSLSSPLSVGGRVEQEGQTTEFAK